MVKRYAFFPGCFVPVRLPHIEHVTRKVISQIGVELIDVKGFTCCPEPVGFGLHDKLTWLTIAARNISLAEEQGMDIMTICNGCYYTLKHTLEELKDKELNASVNETLAEIGREFKGKSKIKHFVQVLIEDVGVDEIKQHVKFPLEGLNVAAHTGCHFSNQYGLDASVLDRLISTLGAKNIEYAEKNLCCGWMLTGYGQSDAAYEWIRDRINSVKNSKGDCMAVICPQCLHQFDTGQMTAARKVDIPFKVPVLFYLQLLGLAMGYSLEEMQYPSHRIREVDFENKIKEIEKG